MNLIKFSEALKSFLSLENLSWEKRKFLGGKFFWVLPSQFWFQLKMCLVLKSRFLLLEPLRNEWKEVAIFTTWLIARATKAKIVYDCLFAAAPWENLFYIFHVLGFSSANPEAAASGSSFWFHNYVETLKCSGEQSQSFAVGLNCVSIGKSIPKFCVVKHCHSWLRAHVQKSRRHTN